MLGDLQFYLQDPKSSPIAAFPLAGDVMPRPSPQASADTGLYREGSPCDLRSALPGHLSRCPQTEVALVFLAVVSDQPRALSQLLLRSWQLSPVRRGRRAGAGVGVGGDNREDVLRSGSVLTSKLGSKMSWAEHMVFT